jgi:radical SAM/SPASM domain protein of ACGX system
MEYFAYQWHITDSCDQRCAHCYIFSEGHPRLVEVTLAQARQVIDSCCDMCRQRHQLPYFYVTGGDPILHSHFWEILALLKEREIPFTLLGNPFHLTSTVCERLKTMGCDKYQLSIDGLRETHDAIRKPGSFDATIAKIPIIRQAGIRCAVMTTVSGTNLEEIPAIVDLVVEHHVDLFAFGRYCPTSFEKSTHIAPDTYRQFLERMWDKFTQYKDCDTVFNLKDHLWQLFLYEKGLFQIPEDADPDAIYDGCHCGDCHLTILPTGDVFACRRFDSKVGNIFTTPIISIYQSDAMEHYRHYEQFEKCVKCPLLRFCRGCPAVAYGYTHNFYATDPQCWRKI